MNTIQNMYTYKLKLLLLINKTGHKHEPRIGQFKASTICPKKFIYIFSTVELWLNLE